MQHAASPAAAVLQLQPNALLTNSTEKTPSNGTNLEAHDQAHTNVKEKSAFGDNKPGFVPSH